MPQSLAYYGPHGSRRWCFRAISLLIASSVLATTARAEEPAAPEAAAPPYTQQQDVVFGQTDGVALVMDIFRPTGPSSGLGMVDIASGGWHSDRGKIEDHKKAQMYDISCRRGVTVFAVRPGSFTKFSALEMAQNVKYGIRWVKEHAAEYGIDPDRLALGGASAGGHLTCLVATTADDGDPQAKDPVLRHSSRVKACVAFFPPTDFLKWTIMGKLDLNQKNQIAEMLGNLLFAGGYRGQSREEIDQQLLAISPARHVTSACPPILLIHGTADFVVPIEQSRIMLAALQEAGVTTDLVIKKGGGHPWPTIHEEVAVAADWLDKQIRAEAPAPAEAVPVGAGQ